MELVTVVTVGVTLLGEQMTGERAMGGALIVAGIVGYGLLRSPESATTQEPSQGWLTTLLKKRQTGRRVGAGG